MILQFVAIRYLEKYYEKCILWEKKLLYIDVKTFCTKINLF